MTKPKTPAAPTALLDEEDLSQVRPDDGDEFAPRARTAPLPAATPPLCPAGYAMFRNEHPEHLVRVTIYDGNNKPRIAKVRPGEFEVFPLEYADVVKRRAPQLVEVSRKSSEPVESD